MPASTHIFLIEDDFELAEMMKGYLSAEGFQVTHHGEGSRAVPMVKEARPDLVVLDVMLPGLDGVSVCRDLKAALRVPVLMLTAKGDEVTEVLTLNLGADGYLNKPVRPHVLLAHIKALLRLTRDGGESLNVQDLKIRPKAFQVFRSGEEIMLTAGEFQLLLLLAQQAGQPVSRSEISNQLKGIQYDGQDRSIDIRVSSLRKKLRDESSPYRYIRTVRSQGYVLVK